VSSWPKGKWEDYVKKVWGGKASESQIGKTPGSSVVLKKRPSRWKRRTKEMSPIQKRTGESQKSRGNKLCRDKLRDPGEESKGEMTSNIGLPGGRRTTWFRDTSVKGLGKGWGSPKAMVLVYGGAFLNRTTPGMKQ